MKKTLLVACAASALSLFAVNAQAADVTPVADSSSFYVSLFGGASFLNDVDAVQHYDSPSPDYDYTLDTKMGYILGGTIGMRVWDPLRAEVEVSYARWKADSYSGQNDDGGDKFSGDASGHVSATYLLGNLWYDIDTGTSFTPYVGGGAGVAWVDASTQFDDSDDYGYNDGEVGFAFQAGAGVTFDLTENIALDVGYRFKGILGVDFDARDSSDTEPYEHGDLYSHNVQAGVIFKF